MEKKNGEFGGRNRITYSDPAMCMVGFSRRTHGGNGVSLFGSSVRNNAVITLTISHAEMDRHLSNDWFHSNGKIIEVDLSPAQFAELLTTLNIGDGVPGTLTYTEKDGVIALPDFPSTAEHFKSEIKRDVQAVAHKLKAFDAELTEILDNPNPLNKDRKVKIKGVIESVRRLFDDHLPFIMNQFQEKMAGTVQECKAEVDAFVTNTIVKTGITELKKQHPQIEDLNK